jgi:hypothetical protein
VLEMRVDVAKAFFFDRDVVVKSADAATRRNQSKFGAFTRRNARDLLKYKKRPSSPGQAPAVHRTLSRPKKRKDGSLGTQAVSPLKEFVFFALDLGGRVVVIGPAKLNRPGDAPHALEYGGTSSFVRQGKTVTINVAPRPFMRPSFEKAKRDLPEIWRDSISR